MFSLCVLGFIFGLIFINSAFGQVLYTGHSSFSELKLQVEHRNADGQLLGYYESELAYVTNLFLLNEYLDALDAKEIIEKDGQTIEIFIIHKQAVFSKSYNGQFSSYNLYHKGESILEIRQDGYYGEAGDTASATFKIGRFV